MRNLLWFLIVFNKRAITVKIMKGMISMEEKRYTCKDADIYTLDNLHEEDRDAADFMLSIRDSCKNEWVDEYIEEQCPYYGDTIKAVIKDILGGFTEYAQEKFLVKVEDFIADKIDSYPV